MMKGNIPTHFSEYGDYPDLSQISKILVVVLRNIGDVILASPVFTVLKEHLPEATIDALVNSGTEEVLMGNPTIGSIHILNRNALKKGGVAHLKEELRLFSAIRSAHYTMVIVLTSGSRGEYLAFLSGAKVRVGIASRKKVLFGKGLTIPVRQAPANRHYVERNLDCLRRIGIFPTEDLRSTSFFEGEHSILRVKKLLAKTRIKDGDPYILLHPTSRWMFKCWAENKVAALIDLIQKELCLPVILTSGPEKSETTYIKTVLNKTTTDIIDFSGLLSLRELGALIRGAQVFVGVDSAPMHISSAVKTPVVALFGPTSESDWGPWGDGHKVITMDSYSCRPCNRDGCGGSKVSECLTNLEVTTVFSAVKKQLLRIPSDDGTM